MARVAVVLFNLGGPDRPESVRPFLFNLFNDRAIIGLPQPLRWLLAQLISRRRAPLARDIYAKIGGRSPLLEQTKSQAEALATALADLGTVRVFPCMRYWHPMSDEVARDVKAFAPDDLVLLPLYPQFSTTTSESSLKDWNRAADAAGLVCSMRGVGCYPLEPGWIRAQVELIAEELAAVQTPVRLLLSAHGLPKRVVDRGDPYQWQVEQTATALVAGLADQGLHDIDHVVCYQSRVGPLEWIGPSTDDEIKRAGRDGVAVVVVPIAFVSEHSETLVELDIEYRHLAETNGVPVYRRVATVTAAGPFIGGLAALVRQARAADDGETVPQSGSRICPPTFQRCICGEPARGLAA